MCWWEKWWPGVQVDGSVVTLRWVTQEIHWQRTDSLQRRVMMMLYFSSHLECILVSTTCDSFCLFLSISVFLFSVQMMYILSVVVIAMCLFMVVLRYKYLSLVDISDYFEACHKCPWVCVCCTLLNKWLLTECVLNLAGFGGCFSGFQINDKQYDKDMIIADVANTNLDGCPPYYESKVTCHSSLISQVYEGMDQIAYDTGLLPYTGNHLMSCSRACFVSLGSWCFLL